MYAFVALSGYFRTKIHFEAVKLSQGGICWHIGPSHGGCFLVSFSLPLCIFLISCQAWFISGQFLFWEVVKAGWKWGRALSLNEGHLTDQHKAPDFTVQQNCWFLGSRYEGSFIFGISASSLDLWSMQWPQCFLTVESHAFLYFGVWAF